MKYCQRVPSVTASSTGQAHGNTEFFLRSRSCSFVCFLRYFTKLDQSTPTPLLGDRSTSSLSQVCSWEASTQMVTVTKFPEIKDLGVNNLVRSREEGTVVGMYLLEKNYFTKVEFIYLFGCRVSWLYHVGSRARGLSSCVVQISCSVAHGLLVPWPGTEPKSSALQDNS